MDSGRLGRVLGVGARHAAKTLVGAVDAATAANPRAAGGRSQGSPTGQGGSGLSEARPSPVRQATRVSAGGRTTTAQASSAPTRSVGAGQRGVMEGSRRFGRAVWEPTARLGGVLWLEVTGLFFGIFMLVAAGAAWRLRGAMRAGAQHGAFLLAVAMMVLFGYFTVSSFLSASRRSRRR